MLGLVQGRYSRTVVGNQPVTIKKYRLTTKGKQKLKAVKGAETRINNTSH